MGMATSKLDRNFGRYLYPNQCKIWFLTTVASLDAAWLLHNDSDDDRIINAILNGSKKAEEEKKKQKKKKTK